MKFSDSTSFFDRFLIIKSTLYKIIKGYFSKIFLKKSKGVLFVGKNVSLLNSHHISVGKNVKFEKNSEIQGLSDDGITLGDNVTIGHTVMIRPSSYYGTGNIGKGLSVGNNSSIGPFSYIGCAGKIIIGNDVMIGPRVSMFAENHVFEDISQTIKNQGVINKGIIVEDNCWIGSGVIILDGVTIGKNSIIAAGTLISKNITENSIVRDERNKIIESRLE